MFLASTAWGYRKTHATASHYLEQAGLIPVAIANQMRAMVGFRNVAVHQYQQPGIPVLCSTLDHRLGGFTAFTAGVIRANVAT